MTGTLAAEALVQIVNRRGLHARAAAKLVNLAESLDAEIVVTYDDQSVSARSIMGLMMLGAGLHATVSLSATGPSAAAAISALSSLISAGFHETD